MNDFNCKIGKVTHKANKNVFVLNPDRPDMAHFMEKRSPTTDFEVMNHALNDGITDVVVLGYDRSGEFTVRSSHPDRFHTIGLLERAVKYVMPW